MWGRYGVRVKISPGKTKKSSKAGEQVKHIARSTTALMRSKTGVEGGR
jgi:hypothetical protein